VVFHGSKSAFCGIIRGKGELPLVIDIEKLKREVGEKLKAAREDKGLSQEELAGMLGLSKVGYGALERGKNLVGLQYLVMLTFILEKPITFFLPAYVVSDFERNDPLLDPLLQEFISLWSDLPSAVQESLLNFVRVFLEARREKRGQ